VDSEAKTNLNEKEDRLWAVKELKGQAGE